MDSSKGTVVILSAILSKNNTFQNNFKILLNYSYVKSQKIFEK